MAREIKFEIKEHKGTLSTSARGWTLELNVVSWNDREPKLDLRQWSPDHSSCGKGITLTQEEFNALKKL